MADALSIVIILALICINGALAMAEIALISSRRIRLQQRAESGDEGARRALALSEEPTRFLSTVQIGITLVSLVSGVFGGARLSGPLARGFQDIGVGEGLSESLSYVSIVVVILYFSLVFGELVPKRLGLQRPERVAAFVAAPMQALAFVGSPFVKLLSASTIAVLRLLRVSGEPEASVTEEEIRLMIGMSAKEGSVALEEAELLDRVFHFGDRQVHEVMIPRTEAVWLEKDDSVGAFLQVYNRAPHSRFPVFDDTQDNVVGILGIKDVLRGLAEGAIDSQSGIAPLVRAPHFVPETKLIGDLFRELQTSGTQMAIAVDEFGGTAGIVTLELLLEEMFGPLRDELRPTEVEIQAIDERTHQVEGSLGVDEARDELGLDIPEGPYDTIAGYVLSRLGHIPVEGEQLTVDNLRITVAEMKGPKIESLRVTRQ